MRCKRSAQGVFDIVFSNRRFAHAIDENDDFTLHRLFCKSLGQFRQRSPADFFEFLSQFAAERGMARGTKGM